MLDSLIALLKKIEDNVAIKDYGDDVILSEHPDVIQAINLAETVLITGAGAVNWGAVSVMRQHGYEVFPIEQDSFGWLLAGISTSKGIILYG
jgi:hypothetical protein